MGAIGYYDRHARMLAALDGLDERAALALAKDVYETARRRAVEFIPELSALESKRKRADRDRKRRGIQAENGRKVADSDRNPVISDLGGRGESLSDLDLPLPFSKPSGEVTDQVSTVGLSGETAPEAQAVNSPSAVALPPPRLNPAVLVEHFAGGVNEAGGVWTCPSGKPFTDLAAALQPHAARLMYEAGVVGSVGRPMPLVVCRVLGQRWFAYCAGAPKDAWKAAAWLGEGAPEAPRGATPVAPTPAQERRRLALELEAAKERERAHEAARRAEGRVRAPPGLAAFAETLGRIEPPSGTRRVASAEDQIEALERMQRAEGE